MMNISPKRRLPHITQGHISVTNFFRKKSQIPSRSAEKAKNPETTINSGMWNE
jgi:hypothetical protein